MRLHISNLGLFCALAASLPATVFTIDNFSSPLTLSVTTASPAGTVVQNNAGLITPLIGGTRSTQINATSNAFGVGSSPSVAHIPPAGPALLSLETPTGTTGYAVLQYTFGGPLALDNSFRIAFLAGADRFLTYQFTLFSSGGSATGGVLIGCANPSVGGPGCVGEPAQYSLMVSTMTVTGSFNPGAITGLRVLLNQEVATLFGSTPVGSVISGASAGQLGASPDLNLQLLQFTNVPEPSTYALSGLALVAIALVRRHHSRRHHAHRHHSTRDGLVE